MSGSNIGTAYVQIVPAATGITQKMEKAIAPGAASAGVTAGKTISQSIGSTMQRVGGGMMKVGGIMTGLGAAATAVGSKFVASARATEESQTKLREVMRAMMNATQGEVDAVNDLISAEAMSGVVGKGAQRNGAQQLATYLHSTDALKTLIPAMNDLAVQQYGTAASADQLVGISNMMGKVFTGQVGALRRAGISFDENSEKILKNGTEQEKAAELARVVAQNVGNMNQEFAKTDSGKITKAKQAIAGIGNQIGAQLLPHVAKVAELVSKKVMPKVQKLLDFLANNPAIAKVAVAITGILTVGGPLLVMLGGLVSRVGALIPVVTAISAPVLAVVGAIVAVAAAIGIAYAKNEQFRKAVNNAVKQIGAAVKSLFSAIMPIIKSILAILVQLIVKIAKSLVPVIQKLTPIVVKVINLITAGVKKAAPIITGVIKTIADIISKTVSTVMGIVSKLVGFISKIDFSGVVNRIKSTFSKVADFIGTPFRKAKEIIDKAVKTIKGIFPLKLGKIFSGIKLPHFKISGGKIPWGIGGMGKKPTVDIQWYAKGGVFNNASVIGVGEAGKEAAIPLQGRYMRPFAEAIAEQMTGAGNTYNIGDISLNVDDLKDIVTLEQFIEVVKRAKAFA